MLLVKRERADLQAGTVMMVRRSSGQRSQEQPAAENSEWQLKLYVAGHTPRALAAFANLKRICEKYLKGRYRIEVVDLLINPAFARIDQIVAVPSLVRMLPEPAKKLVGDLASEERVVAGLEMIPLAMAGSADI